MLTRLSIQNYAIIDNLQVNFTSGLNVITGETGAGKSIIVGALSLILGDRADTSVLQKKDAKCVIEGTFAVKGNEPVRTFLEVQDLDYNDDVMIRREISATGKSRAFINDTPVNLSQLNQLAKYMVDLHQQFDSLVIGESDFQFQVVDALAGNQVLLSQYQQQYTAMQQSLKRLQDTEERKRQSEKELDYHQFQYNELDEAALRENELEQLEEELKLLSNADELKVALQRAVSQLNDGDEPLVRQLKSTVNDLSKYADVQQQIADAVARLQSSYIELHDIASELETINNSIDADPERLNTVQDKLSVGYRLLKKHGVTTTNELIQIRSELEGKLRQILNLDDDIKALQKSYEASKQSAENIAAKLSASRLKQVEPFVKRVNELLRQVGMPNARLKVALTPSALHINGAEDVQFLFNANVSSTTKSAEYLPVRKVASGGELSRLMLSIKSLVAGSIDLPTMVFDEIDTGISGEAARQVGLILKSIAKSRQIIAITHQPQLAGKADTHFFVYKQVVQDSVVTSIKQLSADERIVAIAKMLSGEKPTAAALENAREMVMN